MSGSGVARGGIDRRGLLRGAVAAGCVAASRGEGAVAAGGRGVEGGVAGLIDVFVHLSRWPTRRLRGDEAGELVSMLRRAGVTGAWAGSYDAVLHRDMAGVNARLAEECARWGAGFLVPFGCVNPMLPDWEEDLRRCVEEHRMPGIRLYPSYHGYGIGDAGLGRLLAEAARCGLIVQLVVGMEDRRMMHPLLRVENPDLKPLGDVARRTSGLRLVLLGALGALRGQALIDLLGAGDISVEISMLEGVGGLGALLERVPADRVLFGSHAPLFYLESALLKLEESALGADASRAIRCGNASRYLGVEGGV